MKIKIVLLFNLIFFYLVFYNISNASTKTEGISNFPQSYRPYLQELKNRYPNWTFVALYTGLDWNMVINSEIKYGVSLVPKNYSDGWKNTTSGIYNVEVDSGWVNASRRAVEYAMDPRNFLNEVRIFQFENLSYDATVNTKDGIENVLYGTEFYNRTITGKKYSDLILDAAKISKVSAYHLASRIRQEVGPFLSHPSISGSVAGYEGLYNYYNIGATSHLDYMQVIKNGLQYAKDGKGASQATKDKYQIPWNSHVKAITGGGIFIGSSYINVGQNTIYLQKFDVNDEKSGELFWHQYMTNVLAPYTESKLIYNGYLNNNMLQLSMTFIIPVYNNMPALQIQRPDIPDSDYILDNTKVYADVTGNVNVRTGPSTSYEILTQVTKNDVLTRIGKGKQAGELWDKVILQNGMFGYVFASYFKEVPQQPEIIEKSEEPIISEEPEEIPDTVVEISENQSYIITGNLRVEEEIISNLNLNKLLVKDIKENIVLNNLNMVILNLKDYELRDEDFVGTGTRIMILDIDNNIISEYTFIIYGDVDGDGQITSIDLLKLQRHILEIEALDLVFELAGDTSKNKINPTSVDLLRIQRHILELQLLNQ